MPEQTINGHHADTIPIQTKPVDFDPYMPPLRPDTPPDAVPEQDPQPAPEPEVDDEQQDQAQGVPRRYFHRVRAIAGHKHTRTAARQVVYVAAGTRLTVKAHRDRHSEARHHRWMAAAEAKGDHATALLWEERAAAHRAARHARRQQLLHMPVHAAKGGAYTIAAATGLLALTGVCLAAADHNPAAFVTPFTTAADVIQFTVTLASILWAPAALTAVFVGIAVLWAGGRKRAELPTWLAPAGQAKAGGESITPSRVVVALRELGLADLTRKIKAMGDQGATMLSLIRVAGCGVEVDVTLPEGTSTLEIQNKRRKLAENLHRHEHEVFITIPPAARTVRIWVADSGALDDPIGPSPLVTDTSLRGDVYNGKVPWGQDLRGDQIALSLFQRNILLTGASNQGKTAALRALMLWVALDPAAEFWMADLKGVGDWSPFNGIATTLIQGPTDVHVEQACNMIDRGVAEMNRRILALEKTGSTDGVTKAMAYKPGSGFHPLFIVVDESQVAFMCPAKDAAGLPLGGTKATSRFYNGCRTLLNQCRVVNVHLVLGTQDPTDQNLPKIIREAFHIRGALFLGTESQAAMALGETVVEAGAAPHKLRMGIDKGMLVLSAGDAVALPPGQSFVTVRTHYISGKDAKTIEARAKALRKPIVTGDGDSKTRDLLADVASVLLHTETLVKSSEVVQRLVGIDAVAYKGWTTERLGAELAPSAVIPRKTNGGSMHVDHAEVRAAVEKRGDSGNGK